MLRRTFLTLLGTVAWPWRKKQITVVRGTQWHKELTFPKEFARTMTAIRVRNVSGQRIAAGTLIKFIGDDNGVIPV